MEIDRNFTNILGINKALEEKSENNLKKLKSSFSRILNEKVKSVSDKEKYNKKLKSVSVQMEAIFINLMLKTMRKTVHESGFFGKTLAKDIFSDMLYEEYSKIMAKSGQFGLAKQIYEQFHK